MVEPVTVIVAALAAGAAAGGKDAAAEAIRDAYRALRGLLGRLGKDTEVERVEAAPPARAEELATSDAAKELAEALRAEPEEMLSALVPAAERLEESVASSQDRQAWSVWATYHHCFNLQTGDHNTMTNHYSAETGPSA